jgi:hypothetical protein
MPAGHKISIAPVSSFYNYTEEQFIYVHTNLLNKSLQNQKHCMMSLYCIYTLYILLKALVSWYIIIGTKTVSYILMHPCHCPCAKTVYLVIICLHVVL